MPTLTIKNIPEDLYIQLKQHAEINRRSLNNEVIMCIERAIRPRRLQPEEYLARARQLRMRTKTMQQPVTDEELDRAKRMGRP